MVLCMCIHVRRYKLPILKAIVDACNERNVEDTSRRNLAFLVAGGLPPAWRAGGWARGSDFGLVGFA